MKPIALSLLLVLLPFGLRAEHAAGYSALPAADSVAAVSAADAARLPAEADALREKTSSWERILERLPAISGYVQLGYEAAERSSTFFIKRVRLNLAGNLAPKLGYRVQIEFASPKVVDAYVEWKPLRQLNVKLGEYKVPFSIENTDYVPLKFELIEYPLGLRRLMGFEDVCGLSATGRDMGATLYGGFFRRDGYDVLSYDLGVFNGEGINTKDRNTSKDLSARLGVRGCSFRPPTTGANTAPPTCGASATERAPATTAVRSSCAASGSAARRDFRPGTNARRAASWRAAAGMCWAAGASRGH